MKVAGTVVAAYGRQYRVEVAEGETLLCFPRGKKSELACGDQVIVEQTSADQGVISALEARTTLLYRSDHFKQKLIAANVTQIIIVVATEPPFSDELITRCTVAAENQGIKALIVLNKCDLTDRVAAASAALAQFESLGYRVVKLCARHESALLLPHLAQQTSLLIGQSGMGKSTLTNALVPYARAPTREISQALNAGKHTTTHARLYRLGAMTSLIDSPGLMAFGLHHLSAEDLAQAFPELRPLLGECRFRNCRHDREPDCRVQAALREGAIDPRRYAAFRSLCAEIG
ncbi:putative ribosome biogenesis GTPase RsgA [Candidatus Accumulibacter aalborgensis]|uniref:Small ribosomal subunit biogenesis GTPase RsgA n=1 Tax=Candidatus Accumulibacter aalborgensis TaxID=1860102 RepID=A0A1A8XLY4_9PROT|nr:ribosome small subunit-dependent GTPase A [Candidatus Accumulibacter aalborgensis]SBT06184.1 putative ribosome biogenesis GTPase RsgA [Candidatus Accumulibacter aalborgensis]